MGSEGKEVEDKCNGSNVAGSVSVEREGEGEVGSQSANWEGDPLYSGISVSEVRRFILCKSQYL